MSRAEILAETLARLEAERYTPRASWSLERRPPRAETDYKTYAPVTPEEGAENMRRLMAAIDGERPLRIVHRRAS